MSGNRLTARETAAALRGMDNVLILTHVRPDGDTIGCAAALCQALRDMGKTAYLLYNPEITATYAPCAAPYWAPERFAPEHVVSTDCRTTRPPTRTASSWPSITMAPTGSLRSRCVWMRTPPPAARSSTASSES